MTTVNCKLPPNHFLCLFPCCCVVVKNICSEVPEINKSDAQSSHLASEQNVDERNVAKCCRACFMCVCVYTVHRRNVSVFARKVLATDFHVSKNLSAPLANCAVFWPARSAMWVQ